MLPLFTGYVKDIHFTNVILGNISRSALTIDSGYGSINPSCPSPKKVPVPIAGVTYTNITQATGTWCKHFLDFKGLPDSTIQGVKLENVHIKYQENIESCTMVEGTFHDAPGAEKCGGLKPACATVHS